MSELVDEMLGRMHIEGSWYAGIRGSSPWAFLSEATPVARMIVLTEGECLLTSASLSMPMRLVVGDCVIVQSGVDLVLQDDLSTRPVNCAQLPFDGRQQATLGGGGAVAEMRTGRFSFDVDAAEPLMGSLPPIMRIHLDDQADSSIRTTLHLMSLESSSAMGAGTIIDRLADVLFIQVLRAWCESEEGSNVGWLAALKVPELAAALHAMHGDLAHPWTVAELASVSLMSRSSFAALFKSTIGESPLSYLTRWRVRRAKTLLRDTSLSVLEVAVSVGYESDTALHRAFRRWEQIPPGMWRRQQADRTAA